MVESVQTAHSNTAKAHTEKSTQSSRVGRVWVFMAIFAIILLLLLVFIIQNSASVKIHYLGFSGTLGFGVAMLLSAVAGSILTLLIGSIRIIQLKRNGKKATSIAETLSE